MTAHPAVPGDAVLFGAAYYPEYFPSERMPIDLELMSRAGVTVIRVGESVWSTWEPRDGEFDLDWLRPTLDEAHRRGIKVILGTPTYAVPPWLQKAHPEIAAETATRRRVPWGGRQEVDFTNPVFRRHAARVIRAVVGAYAMHPSVIGYQVDNEPGMHLLHNAAVFARFVDELRARYGTVDRLNEEWGLVYWSHRLTDFDELWTPDGNTLPQYDLAWRAFQAELTTEFLEWQAGIVAEYRRDDQFVTTCLSYSRPALDEFAVGRALDATAANLYYGMQDHLDLAHELPALTPWTSAGVAGLLASADRAYATRQERFLVTETGAQAIGPSEQNLPPYPGQLRQAALALVSRGASMIEYWHWNTIPYGTETFWGGVIPHSGEPGRIHAEAAELGAELAALGPVLRGYEPDADVAVLWSNRSRWAFDFFPPIPAEDRGAYETILGAFHRGMIDAGLQVRFLADEHAAELDAHELAARHPLLVVPALYAAHDDLLDLLAAYADAGGHLVLGPRTAYADHEARARVERAPARLAGTAGVWYEEYSNLSEPLPLTVADGSGLEAAGAATRWIDGLIVDGAEVVARYEHAEHKRFPAITTRATGDGRVTVIGTIPDAELGASLGRWLVPEPVSAGWPARHELPVTVQSGRTEAGGRVWFVHNWSGSPVELDLPGELRDLDGTAASGRVELGPRGAGVWIGRA